MGRSPHSIIRTPKVNLVESLRLGVSRAFWKLFLEVFGARVWDENKHSFWQFVLVFHYRAFEVGFAPRTVLRQVLLAIWLQSLFVVGRKSWKVAREHVFLSSEAYQLYQKMRTATSYNQWKMAAERLDVIQRHANWKATAQSTIYDWKRLERKLQHFEDFILHLQTGIHCPDDPSMGYEGLMFHVRAGLKRDQGGLDKPKLYSRAHVGTKNLIERFVSQMANLLHMVADSEQLTGDTKLAFFNQTRHAYGRTALLLSGGATMGLFHLGIVKALHDQKLLPHILSGASAGSIVAALVACKTEPELEKMFIPSCYENWSMLGSLEEMTQEYQKTHSSAWPARLRNLIFKGVLFDTEVLKKFLKEHVMDLTFQEAFERTGRVLNITVQPENPGQGASRQPRLLNYLTYPSVLVWSAALASCAIPGVFRPVELMAKDPQGKIFPYSHDGVKYADGSFGNDLPMLRLKELFNVNLFIVSQVNPISIFVGNGTLGQSDPISLSIRFLKNQATAFLRNLWRTEFMKKIPLLSVLIPTITQDMEGDITCVAPVRFMDYVNLLDNPTPERLEEIILRAERNAWPLVAQIDTRCLIEFALDDCIRQVRTQLLEEGRYWTKAGGDDDARDSFNDQTSAAKKHGQHDQVLTSMNSFSSTLSALSLAELAATCEGLDLGSPIEQDMSRRASWKASYDQAKERRKPSVGDFDQNLSDQNLGLDAIPGSADNEASSSSTLASESLSHAYTLSPLAAKEHVQMFTTNSNPPERLSSPSPHLSGQHSSWPAFYPVRAVQKDATGEQPQPTEKPVLKKSESKDPFLENSSPVSGYNGPPGGRELVDPPPPWLRNTGKPGDRELVDPPPWLRNHSPLKDQFLDQFSENSSPLLRHNGPPRNQELAEPPPWLRNKGPSGDQDLTATPPRRRISSAPPEDQFSENSSPALERHNRPPADLELTDPPPWLRNISPPGVEISLRLRNDSPPKDQCLKNSSPWLMRHTDPLKGRKMAEPGVNPPPWLRNGHQPPGDRGLVDPPAWLKISASSSVGSADQMVDPPPWKRNIVKRRERDEAMSNSLDSVPDASAMMRAERKTRAWLEDTSPFSASPTTDDDDL